MSSEVNADTGAAQGDSVNIDLNSPNQAELQVKDKHFSDLQDDVINYVRRNSLLKEA